MLYRVSEQVPYLKLLLYGKPGIGKTYLAATAQDHLLMKDVLVCNIEGGVLTLYQRGDIMAEDVTTVDELESLFWKLANHDPEYEQFRTIVIDSGSELQTADLEMTVRRKMEKERKENRNKVHQSPDEIWQDDYGENTNRLKRVFRWFKNLDRHVVITALPKFVYPRNLPKDIDPASVEPIAVSPQFTEKLGEAVMGYVDFVWYMYFDPETGKRCLLTQEHGVFRAKTRGMLFSQQLGQVVVDPKLPDIYDILLKAEAPGLYKKIKGGSK